MRKADALAHFDGNQSELARVLETSRSTVNAWPDVVPLMFACALEILTRRRCKVEERLYPRLKRAREIVERQNVARQNGRGEREHRSESS